LLASGEKGGTAARGWKFLVGRTAKLQDGSPSGCRKEKAVRGEKTSRQKRKLEKTPEFGVNADGAYQEENSCNKRVTGF